MKSLRDEVRLAADKEKRISFHPRHKPRTSSERSEDFIQARLDFIRIADFIEFLYDKLMFIVPINHVGATIGRP